MGEMLNDLIFSVNTILPVFIVVAIGYFMRRRGTVDASISSVLFPMLCFIMHFRPGCSWTWPEVILLS